MRVELVGGPNCGEIVAGTPDLMPTVVAWDTFGNAVTYRRRDVSTSIKPTYGKAGHRMYEVIRHG